MYFITCLMQDLYCNKKKWLVLKDVVQIYVYALNPDLDCKWLEFITERLKLS